jgi:hypothetical protein
MRILVRGRAAIRAPAPPFLVRRSADRAALSSPGSQSNRRFPVYGAEACRAALRAAAFGPLPENLCSTCACLRWASLKNELRITISMTRITSGNRLSLLQRPGLEGRASRIPAFLFGEAYIRPLRLVIRAAAG